MVNIKTTIPLRVGEELWIYTSTLRYISTTIHLPFISSFIFTLRKPKADCKVGNIFYGFSEKISLHVGSFGIEKHYTNHKHLLQQSIAHKISVQILKQKYKKISVLLEQLTKSMIKYTSYKNLGNLLQQLLSCKISYNIQLKNIKYLPPQSLACEIYRKQEN